MTVKGIALGMVLCALLASGQAPVPEPVVPEFDLYVKFPDGTEVTYPVEIDQTFSRVKTIAKGADGIAGILLPAVKDEYRLILTVMVRRAEPLNCKLLTVSP